MKFKIWLLIISIFSFSGIYAQGNDITKAIYIDNFFKADSSQIILGDSVAEKQLFDYAQNCGFNYLILYGLSAVPLGNNPDAVDALRSFVRRAHEDYHIKLGCIGQSSKFFNRIHQKYQALDIVDSIERLDSYNLEFEFWKSYHADIYEGYYCEYYLAPNGYSCDSIGAFEFAMDELTKIDSLAALLSDTSVFQHPTRVTTEIYVGWINEYHAEVLAAKASKKELDRILGAVYKTAEDDGSLNLFYYFHQVERLEFFGNTERPINFLPIFAVKEKQGNHLQDWMDTIGSIPYVWEHYAGQFERDTILPLDSIHLEGYVWYNYSQMPLCFDSIYNDGWLQGPEGELVADSTYEFSLLDSEGTDRFYWELPEGVKFADSIKWDSHINLHFSSSFQQGDSIAVRAANRCHLGEHQYFGVQYFDAIPKLPKLLKGVFYLNGMVYIQFRDEIPKFINYQIFNLQGQLLKSGVLKGKTIKFHRNIAYNILRIELNGKRESYVF